MFVRYFINYFKKKRTVFMKRPNNLEKVFRSRFKLNLYFLKALPMAYFAGLKVDEFTEDKVSVSVPFKWSNKNPFKSMYFAVQSMAAELSSAVIALSAIANVKVPVSMLVLKMEAEFTKKARTKVVFTCKDVQNIKNTVSESISTGEGKTVKITSTGLDLNGEVVSVFYITWTFKPKN